MIRIVGSRGPKKLPGLESPFAVRAHPLLLVEASVDGLLPDTQPFRELLRVKLAGDDIRNLQEKLDELVRRPGDVCSTLSAFFQRGDREPPLELEDSD